MSTPKPEPKFKVGDRVLIRSNYKAGNGEGTVVKVGRVLVTIENRWGHKSIYRMDSGAKNDDYGHSRIMTEEEWDQQEREGEEQQRTQDLGYHITSKRDRQVGYDLRRKINDVIEQHQKENPS